jgi:flagellum-specific peptidoglycan hydrolase FlgJ
MSLLNGLAAMGESVAKTAGMMSLEAMRASLEEDRVKLASEMAATRESAGRKESHALDMDKLKMQQEYGRPAQEASINASNAQTDQARTTTEIAKAKEGRLQSGIKAAEGGARGTLSEEQRKFLETVRPFAEEAARKTGVDPKIIIAQAALETGWGKSIPANNYLGVKSHGQPGGQTLDTTEAGPDGRPVKTKDSFRTYNSPGESFEDYARFIAGNSRYRELQGAKGLDAQIEALGRSGYATDPQYAQKIATIARSLGDGGGAANNTAASREGLRLSGDLDKMAELDFRREQEQNKRGMPTPGEQARARMDKGTPAAQQLFEFYNSLSPEDQIKFRQLNKGDVKLEFREHNGKLVAINPNTLQAGVVDIPGADKKPPPEAFKKLEAEGRSTAAVIDRYEDVLKRNNGGNIQTYLNDPTSPQAQEFVTAFNNMKMALRSEAFANTGVLQPAEMAMLEKELLAPNTLRGLMQTPEAATAKLDELRRFIDTKLDAAYKANGYEKPADLQFYREREGAGNAESDASGFGAGGGPRGAADIPRPTDKAAFDALPSGATFLAPDGILRRKP